MMSAVKINFIEFAQIIFLVFVISVTFGVMSQMWMFIEPITDPNSLTITFQFIILNSTILNFYSY